jgi:hypothetical protein
MLGVCGYLGKGKLLKVQVKSGGFIAIGHF